MKGGKGKEKKERLLWALFVETALE